MGHAVCAARQQLFLRPSRARHSSIRRRSISRRTISSLRWRSNRSADPALKITVTPKPGADGTGARLGGGLADGLRAHLRWVLLSGERCRQRSRSHGCGVHVQGDGCPGAQVKLFTKRGDDIENAVGADRSLYRKLASALSFRRSHHSTCSCRRPTGVITSGPVFDDPTLKSRRRHCGARPGTRLQGRLAALLASAIFRRWSSLRCRRMHEQKISASSLFPLRPFRRAARARGRLSAAVESGSGTGAPPRSAWFCRSRWSLSTMPVSATAFAPTN